MRWEYNYHDQFQRDVLSNLPDDDSFTKTHLKNSGDDARKFIENLLHTYDSGPAIPEYILNARFHRILFHAQKLAFITSSNLCVERSKQHLLTIQIEGDFLIIDDPDTMQHLIMLLSSCLNFRIFPTGHLFQLHFFYDLRLLEP